MRALTIQNPYAHLILTPQDELPEWTFQKRCENRVWNNTKIRGTIAIHAGVSMLWFKHGDYPSRTDKKPKPSDYPEMSFGAIIGTVELVTVLHIDQILGVDLPDEYEWLIDYPHMTGPYCYVLDNPVRFKTPIPCKGMLGFWRVPEDIVAQMESLT